MKKLNNFGNKMKTLITLIVTLSVVLLSGCAILKAPTVVKNGSVDNYKYVVIPSTNELSSGTGAVVGGQYGVYGGSVSKEVDPGAVIEGIFLKRGLISLSKIHPDKIDETIIVRYGESGKRVVAGGLGGYTLEATIIVLDAKTYDTIYTCTAEGQGSTEADDIREAITRCLSGL